MNLISSGIASLRFGLLVALVLTALLSCGIAVWEWVDNPGGIYRDATGTDWSIVIETVTSWFLPSFPVLTLLAGLIHWLINRR